MSEIEPRVGDRVLVSGGEVPGAGGDNPSTTGTVVSIANSFPFPHRVDLDQPWSTSSHDSRTTWRFTADRLTVLDRKPVEWPEGWEKYRTGDSCWIKFGQAAITREELTEIRGPNGDYVAEHWDELMGGNE